ncbi:nuclear transport factor 2 family protein [Subtercola boreus]|uniref:SnoaL-like domain-containing protein n=1 Tax=Subtercola boreus TaxID=120213 RepID=A0A3E0W7C7_9MICO|nr:nuclear transport factor 2 family protein [Subtercola boreus]RFA18857.1 hypothetical protein B7R24_14005 [Subtercola boreus]RFA18974.1 hypothetical protein B7R23_13995 [Subtercola boreus]RFA25509.1 hypothetical protein B7R25_14105 [Subtercola boreus]
MTNISPLPPTNTGLVTAETVTSWIEKYLRAWETNDRDDIAALFTEDAEYHERPFDTEWIGREDIIQGWRGRWEWQQGGWTFESTISGIHDRTAVITGLGHYTELGDFDNVWTVTFDELGRCTRFEMVNTERP